MDATPSDSTLDVTSDDSPSDDAPSDAAVDGSAPNYCATFTTNQTTCGNNDACTQAREAQCPTLLANYSAQFLAAYIACDSMWACPDGGPDTTGGAAFRQCVAGKLAPDAAAQKLAQDVCTSCVDPSKLTQCEQNFYTVAGVTILQYDDTIITDVDTTCGTFDAGSGGEAGACVATFTDCATKAIRSSLPPPPAACTDN